MKVDSWNLLYYSSTNKGLKAQAQDFLEISKEYYPKGKFNLTEDIDFSKNIVEILKTLMKLMI